MEFPAYDANEERHELKLFTGTVTSVNQEKQTMTVSVSNKGEIGNIAINNSVSINGVGYRYCPIPFISQVILYDQNGVIFHLGYVYNPHNENSSTAGMSAYTNNNAGNKNLTGSVLLQRNLSFGESSLMGFGGSEIYMANDGSVHILNSSMLKILLDSNINALLVTAPSQYTEHSGIIVRSGSVLRKTKGVANALEPYYRMSGNILAASDITDVLDLDYCSELSEFSIDVGVEVSDVTNAYDRDSSPKSARFSVADIVLDEAGDPITHNGNFLKVLLESTSGCGRVCIDDLGTIWLVDTTEDKNKADSISFSPGDHTSFKASIENSVISLYKDELNFHNPNSDIVVTSTGNVHISNTSDTSIDISKDGAITIKTCAADDKPKCTVIIDVNGHISIQGADGDSLVKAILGETFLTWITDKVVKHTHGTSMGATTPSTLLEDFQADTYLSNVVKHN